jgi:energy-coupling factor transporter ATP-binding protein EcfA2
MVKHRYREIETWLEECRATVRADDDNVVLFTGATGAGKSTIAVQVMRALDPTFNVSRIWFTIPTFLRGVRAVPKYCAALLDEAPLNKRKAMFRDTIRLVDDFQISRGRNHHVGLCFPYDDLLDDAIKDYRVRWNIHVPRRGIMQLRRRLRITSAGGRVVYRWSAPLGAWRSAPNKGPLWEAYLRAKEEHMRRPLRDEEEAAAESEVDAALRRDLARILLKYESTPGASIRGHP